VLAGVGVKMKAAANAVTMVKITTTAAKVPEGRMVPDGNLFRILAPAPLDPMQWNPMH
jgi:hypothetical protein